MRPWQGCLSRWIVGVVAFGVQHACSHSCYLLLSVRFELILIKSWHLYLAFFSFFNCDFIWQLFKLLSQVERYLFVSPKDPLANTIARSNRVKVPSICLDDNFASILEMARKGLLRRYHLASEVVVIHSDHVFFSSHNDEFAVWSHLQISRLFVCDAVLLTHNWDVALVSLGIDPQNL